MNRENLTQQFAILGAIHPAASQFATGSFVSDTVDASIFPRLAALVEIGTLAGAGTVNVRWQHCSGSLSSDSAWADVNATSAITSTFGSAAANSKNVAIELRLDQNPSTSRYVRALATVATSTWNGAVILIGEPQFKPAFGVAGANTLASVVY